MTPEQLTLARQFAGAVGWEDRLCCGEPGYQLSNDGVMPLRHLYTGDGMLSVKSEMAKQKVVIHSCTRCDNSAMAVAYGDGFYTKNMDADTEPHAVLLTAVAAMKVSDK